MSVTDFFKTHIEMGVITSPHGIKGDLKVRYYGDQPITSYDPYFFSDGQPFSLIVRSVLSNGLYLCSIQSVKTRTDAERIKGHKFYIPRSALPPLEPDEIYCIDFIGKTVFDKRTQQKLGRVTALHDYGAGLIFELDDAKKTFMLKDDVFLED